jgi:aromatic-L-amino-acid decarboxylase
MTPEEFRTRGHQLVDWIADYRSNLTKFPVMAQTAPGEIRAQLPSAPPESAESFDLIFSDLERIILPGLSHWQNPNFFGYFPSNGLLSSVLGDYASTGLGVLGLSWQSSPALSELEEVTTDWMRQMVGLSSAWSGVIQDTASTCTLVALICARERSGEVVYTSAHSHSSVNKAALLAGFRRENIRLVDHDENFAMKANALETCIEADLAAGRKPCAIVATTGTTTSTALDPVEAIAAIAKKHGIWLHVDAAMAGNRLRLFALLCPRSATPDSRDVDKSELFTIVSRRGGEKSSRLGHPSGPAFPRAENLVRCARARSHRAPDPLAARS